MEGVEERVVGDKGMGGDECIVGEEDEGDYFGSEGVDT